MVIVATLNFQTSLNHTKTQNLFTTLMQNQVDIIALQEINTADLKPIPKDFSCYVNLKPGDLCTAFIYKKSLNLNVRNDQRIGSSLHTVYFPGTTQ